MGEFGASLCDGANPIVSRTCVHENCALVLSVLHKLELIHADAAANEQVGHMLK